MNITRLLPCVNVEHWLNQNVLLFVQIFIGGGNENEQRKKNVEEE